VLKHPTLDLLGQLGLTGMANAFADLAANDEAAGLSHAEWLALLLDHEATWRNDRRLALRLRQARLRHHAMPEDVNYRSQRGLDRRFFEMLIKGDWIAAHENLAIIGPSGIGKSWLACALGHKACRDNRSVLYARLPRLIDELALAKGDGRIAARMKSLARVDLLILDDWGLEHLNANARHHLLEILEDRYGQRSTLVTSQVPISRWHELIGDPTYADAILDRLVHNAHRLELAGESMRKMSTNTAA
jgi:DNA replication protein DnaC